MTSAKFLDLKSKNRPRVVLMVMDEITQIKYVDLMTICQICGDGRQPNFIPTKSTTMGIDSILWKFDPKMDRQRRSGRICSN